MKRYEDYIFHQLEQASKKFSLVESDQIDTITMDIPLLTRLLELVREDIKDDVELHHVVDRLLKIKNQGTLTMDHYKFIAVSSNQEDQPDDINSDDEITSLKKLSGI